MYDVAEQYAKSAAEFGRLLAKDGHTLIWGGSDSGLMKTIADAVQKNGGRTVGVTIERLQGSARRNADELIVTKDLAERKNTMRQRADAFVLLAGGIGSLDEITEILELKKHDLHDKPIVILNTDDFYAGFRSQLERMQREGFIAHPLEDYLRFAATPEETLRFLNER